MTQVKALSQHTQTIGFTTELNSAGVAELPAFKRSHKTKSGRAEAVVNAHPVGDGWVGGYQYAIRSGDCQGETMPPSRYDTCFTSRSRAVEDGLNRLAASLKTKYPKAVGSNKAETTEITALYVWIEKTLKSAKAGKFEPEKLLAGQRFIDLCSGAGGFRLALEKHGAECVLSCEIDEAARETCGANFDVSRHPFPSDITKLDAADVPDHEILAAGFPCQPFSIAGKQLGVDDPRGKLFGEIARIVAVKRPALILLENVPNFLLLDNGTHASMVEQSLACLGYAVSRKILRAVDFGLPQLRERAFFVAVRRDIGRADKTFVFPVGVGHRLKVADILEPDAPNGTISPERIVADATRNPGGLAKRIGRLDGNRYQSAVVMSPDAVGLTLVTGVSGGGLYLINGKPRVLTPRERARMQGFPESFIPHGNYAQACKQFGNSVAVPVVSAIVEAIAKQYFKKPTGLKQALPDRIQDQPLPETVQVEDRRPRGGAKAEPTALSEVTAPTNTSGKGSYIPWAGAKRWSSEVVKAHLPMELGRAIFPFGGAASDALGYADMFQEIHIADLNQDLVNAHALVAKDPEKAIKVLAPLFKSGTDPKKHYLRLRDEFNCKTTSMARRAALFIFLLCHSYRGTCTYNQVWPPGPTC